MNSQQNNQQNNQPNQSNQPNQPNQLMQYGFNPLQYASIGIPDIICQVLFYNQGINWVELRKKIIIMLFFKLVYENLSKFSIDPQFIKLTLFNTLSTCKQPLRLIKDSQITLNDNDKSIKMDSVLLGNLLGIDVRNYVGTNIKLLLSHLTMINATERFIEILYINKDFKEKFINKCKLEEVVTNKIVTEYKILTKQTANDKTTFSLVKPARITEHYDEAKDHEFFEMIETFITNSEILRDIATQSYLINGPSGTGKSTIIDILYHKHKINMIIKLNMMNFIEQDYDFEKIIEQVIKPVESRVENELRLLCFDEIDKWRNNFRINQLHKYVEESEDYKSPEELKQYLQKLDDKFYTTLQRLIDGEILNIPRLIIMFFTNNGETLWDGMTADFESVKARFTMLEFDYCNKAIIISYLRMMYHKLKVTVDSRYYDAIKDDIKITYRKLKALINLKNYDIKKIVNELNQYEGDNHKFTKSSASIMQTINFDELSNSTIQEDDYDSDATNDNINNTDNSSYEIIDDKQDIKDKALVKSNGNDNGNGNNNVQFLISKSDRDFKYPHEFLDPNEEISYYHHIYTNYVLSHFNYKYNKEPVEEYSKYLIKVKISTNLSHLDTYDISTTAKLIRLNPRQYSLEGIIRFHNTSLIINHNKLYALMSSWICIYGPNDDIATYSFAVGANKAQKRKYNSKMGTYDIVGEYDLIRQNTNNQEQVMIQIPNPLNTPNTPNTPNTSNTSNTTITIDSKSKLEPKSESKKKKNKKPINGALIKLDQRKLNNQVKQMPKIVEFIMDNHIKLPNDFTDINEEIRYYKKLLVEYSNEVKTSQFHPISAEECKQYLSKIHYGYANRCAQEHNIIHKTDTIKIIKLLLPGYSGYTFGTQVFLNETYILLRNNNIIMRFITKPPQIIDMFINNTADYVRYLYGQNKVKKTFFKNDNFEWKPQYESEHNYDEKIEN